MSFQKVIDYAETISVERKAVVASTQARSGIVRTVSRGASYWQFTVKLPDGIPWTEIRQELSKVERLDRYTTGTFSFNNAGHSWFIKYQGDSQNYTGFVATATQGSNQLVLTTSPTTISGFKFRAGDIIQLGTTGKCYTVAADVAFNSNSVTLHRPVIDSTGSYNLRVADNCEFTVICRDFPAWTLMARDQVSWSGPFVFVEAL